MLLTSSSLLGLDATTNQPATPSSLFIYGASFPIGDQYSLTADEVNNISTAVTAYNTSIRSMADSYGLAFVDMNKKMVELNSKSGITYNGVKYTATFVSGGTFSLDGVHLTGRGYAIVANEFIKSINAKYRSNLPQVDANKYSGVTFP
jgi:lysophospholipase L1-like esterase